MSPLPRLQIVSRLPVFYVTDRSTLSRPDSATLLEKIRMAAVAGADIIQIRDKQLPTRDLLALARQALEIVNEVGSLARVIVNDRLDVALAAGASGVHLAHDSLPADLVIDWCASESARSSVSANANNAASAKAKVNARQNFLVGVSTHLIDEARDAETTGASYIFFGPIFDTPSKRPFGVPQGLTQLAHVCRAVKVPVIAIGGVNESNMADCLKAGASGIAAIRLFQQAQDAPALQKALSAIRQFQPAPDNR